MTPETLEAIRQYLLGIVAALEREMGDPLTTADMRKWFKKYGPPEEEAARLVAELKKKQP